MKRKIVKFLGGITALVAILLGTMGALPAHAGGNGQQIDIYNPYANFASAVIYGDNQYGQYTEQWVQLYHNGTTWDNNWWWAGTITLYLYNAQGQLQAIETGNVPSFQWDTDWTNMTLTN